MKIYFVRHGESEANAAGVVAVGGVPALTEAGIEQAQSAGVELINHDIQLIVCSPFLRAQQTAEIIAGEIGLGLDKIKVVDELRERYLGEKEGKPKDEPSEWFFEVDAAAGVEPKSQMIERMQTALAKVLELRPENGNILIAGHAVSGFFLLQVAKGNLAPESFDDFHQMGNAGYVEVKIGKNWGIYE